MCEVAALLVEVSVDVVVSSELSRSATNVRPTVQLWNRIYLEVYVELLILWKETHEVFFHRCIANHSHRSV